MVQVYEEPISRRHYAPYFSVAFLYRPFFVGREGAKKKKKLEEKLNEIAPL